MTQRRKRTLDDLKQTWKAKKRPNEPKGVESEQKRENLARSHTNEAQMRPDLPRLKPTHGVVREPVNVQTTVEARESAPAAKSKRVYLNVVLTWDLERRLERAVKFYQRTHGKAFGRSAYGRKALLAQLERDGF